MNDTAQTTAAAASTDAAAASTAQTPPANSQGTADAAAANATKDTALTDKPAAGADAPAAKDATDKPDAAKDAAAKPDAAKADDKTAKPDDKTKDAKDGKDTAPAYQEFVLPEDVKVNPETMGEFTTLAKKHGLPQEAAQEFANLGAKVTQKSASGLETTFTELAAAAEKQWTGESTADKEFGGAALDENLAIAKRAVDAYATPELKAILGKFDKKDNPKGTGLGNNPEFIRLFFRLGKTISPDTAFVEGKGGKDTPNLSPGDRLWGKKT